MAAYGPGNLEAVTAQLDEWGDGCVDGAFKALLEEARRVYDLSQVYVPRDTEALAKSGRLNAELREIDRASVDVVYGGIDSEAEAYAVKQHEELSYRHDPPTCAKYLERAINEVAPGMTMRIGEGAVAAAKARSGVK